MNLPIAEQNFWSKVDFSGSAAGGSCWEWIGRKIVAGYGVMGKKTRGKRKDYYAHRISWAIANGKEPDSGLEVHHTCDNKGCVRPEHLRLVTHRENMLDAIRKGMVPKPPHYVGEAHPRARLTLDQVREIRRDYVYGSRTHGGRALALRYGVATRTVEAVVGGQNWGSSK